MKIIFCFFIATIICISFIGSYFLNRDSAALLPFESTDFYPAGNNLFQENLLGNWTTAAGIPSPRYNGGGAGYIKNDTGWVFVFGGDSTGTGRAGVNLYRYNINTNTWSMRARMPSGRRVMGSAVLKDSLYCIGGIGNSNPPSYNVYRYSINENTWGLVASLPDSLYFLEAVGYQDSLIYTAGGYNAGVAKDAVYLYNSKINSWRRATNLPGLKADGVLSIVRDTLLYICGFDGTGSSSNTVYRGVINQSNRSQITWTSGATGNLRSKLTGAALGSKGVIVGGGALAGYTGTSESRFYNISSNTWSNGPFMPGNICAQQGGFVTYSNGVLKWVIAGGMGPALTITGNVYIYTDTVDVITSVTPVTGIAEKYSLSQNYPNPFNPVTKINFEIPRSGFVSLKVYDITGKELMTLVNKNMTVGSYAVDFNGASVSSGVYFYRLEAESFTETKRMMLVK